MMNGSFERCLSSGLILVTFALTLCQGQGQSGTQSCTLTARPHREGICGQKLASAHANLCFLLTLAYPDIFGKRSASSSSSSSLSSSESLPSSYFSQGGHHRVTGQGHPRARRAVDNDLLERIYSIPLSVLAQLEINEQNWRSFVYKRAAESSVIPGEETDEIKYSLKDLQELPAGPTRSLIRMLSKRSPPSVQKRSVGLVCECCIRQCTPRQMATYC